MLLILSTQLHLHAIPGGKMNRGLTVVASLRAILDRELTEEELFRSSVLGWCIEWVRIYSDHPAQN